MADRKIVYIAGPYRSDTEYGVKLNIERAEAVALKYWKAGYAVFCPHKNSAFMGGACPDETWLEGGLAILARCDALVVMPDWKESSGTIREIEFAEKHRIPVFLDEFPSCPTLLRFVLSKGIKQYNHCLIYFNGLK